MLTRTPAHENLQGDQNRKSFERGDDQRGLVGLLVDPGKVFLSDFQAEPQRRLHVNRSVCVEVR